MAKKVTKKKNTKTSDPMYKGKANPKMEGKMMNKGKMMDSVEDIQGVK